jgi:hypothetical protein
MARNSSVGASADKSGKDGGNAGGGLSAGGWRPLVLGTRLGRDA